MTKKQKITYYVLLVVVSALFLMAAIFKLIGSPMEIAAFASVGLPVWFMYVIGIGELCGVIGLWTRTFFRYAYEGLFIVLAGAFGTTLAVQGPVLCLIPLATGVILAIIIRLNGRMSK